MKIILDFGSSFVRDLQKAMEDECGTACKKWGVRLTSEQRDIALTRSLEQVITRGESIGSDSWKLGESYIYNIAGATGEYSLPEDTANLPSLRIVRASDKWMVEGEVKDEAILLSDFHEAARNEITAWARTAMFYAVGSYKE